MPRKVVTLITSLILTVIAGATVYTLIQNNPSVPKFSYDPSGIDGWWSSENTNLQTLAKRAGNNYRSDEPIDKLPVADLTVHHGEKDAQAPEDYCFVAFSYYNFPIESLNTAYETYESRKKAQGDLTMINKLDQTAETYEGTKEYELKQYNLTIEGEDVLSGYQVGFIELESGYVRVEGVCKTAEELALTLPLLPTVTLNEN